MENHPYFERMLAEFKDTKDMKMYAALVSYADNWYLAALSNMQPIDTCDFSVKKKREIYADYSAAYKVRNYLKTFN